MAVTAKTQKITRPYVPPVQKRLEERGGGPSTPASSLLHRMAKREVDEEVIAVVAWTLSHFSAKPHYNSCWDMAEAEKRAKTSAKLIERIEKELLDDLGLEWHEERMGGQILRPKLEFQQPETELPLWDIWKGKAFLGSTRGHSEADAIERYASWALMPATGLTAKAAKR